MKQHARCNSEKQKYNFTVMYSVNAALEIFVAAWLRTALLGCVNGQLVPNVLNKCHELITVTLGHIPEEWSSYLINLKH